MYSGGVPGVASSRVAGPRVSGKAPPTWGVTVRPTPNPSFQRVDAQVRQEMTVNGDASMLRQALLNLAQNACQAMPDGGTLTLSCVPASQNRVEIRVQDTGVGIDAGCSNSPQTAGSVGFSADPEQRFLYVGSRTPARIWIYDRKTLEPLDSFGRSGVAPGEFVAFHELTTDSKGNIYTAEANLRGVTKYVKK